MKPQWSSLHGRAKARALGATSPLLGREKRAAFGNDKTQEVLGAQQPDLVPAGAALSARAVFLVSGHRRANRIGTWSSNHQSECRQDRAVAVLIGLQWPTRRRSRASPRRGLRRDVASFQSFCASPPSAGVRGLFPFQSGRSEVLLSRRWAGTAKRVKLLLAVGHRELARRLSSHALGCPGCSSLRGTGETRLGRIG